MRTGLTPDFATADDAMTWMDAPERMAFGYREVPTLGFVDRLLARHGLELVETWFQGDAYVSVERIGRDLSSEWHNARHDGTDRMSLAVTFEPWMARDAIVVGPKGTEWVVRSLDRVVYMTRHIPNPDPKAVLHLIRREAMHVGLMPPVVTAKVAADVLDAWWDKATYDCDGSGFPVRLEHDPHKADLQKDHAIEAMVEALREQVPTLDDERGRP